jgi:hypothetical protein
MNEQEIEYSYNSNGFRLPNSDESAEQAEERQAYKEAVR